MKTIVCILFLIISCANFIGCNNQNDSYIKNQNIEINKMNLTTEQIELLKKMSINEKSIEEGNLCSWQVEIINQYNFAIGYLEKKYGEVQFTIYDGVPKNSANRSTIFYFMDRDGTSYELYIYVDNEGTYSAKDNYYETVIKEKYEKILKEILVDKTNLTIKVSTHMSSVQGDEIDREFDVNKLFNREYEIQNDTQIYVFIENEDESETVCKKIQNVIENERIYGSYTVYSVSINEQESEISQLQDYFYKYTFQQFE